MRNRGDWTYKRASRAVSVALGLALAAAAIVVAAPAATAATDDTQEIYLADQSSNQQLRLDAGGSVFAPFATLPTASAVGADSVVLSADGATAYYVSRSNPGALQRADTATGTVTGTVTLNFGYASFYGTQLALSPDGATLYAAGNGGVSVVDAATFTAQAPLALGGDIRGVALSPDGARLYAADRLGNLLYVVTLPDRVVTPVAVSNNPFAIAVSPDGATVAIAFDTPGISAAASVRIANADGSLRTTITPAILGGGNANGATSVAFSPDGSVLYAITSGTSNIVEIDPATGAVLRQVPSGTTNQFSFTSHLAVSSDGARVYLQTTTTVVRYDTVAHAMGPNLGPAGVRSVGIALAPDQAPTASFTVVPGSAGTATAFDASASTSVAGDIAQYAWDFGDGQTAVTTTPTTDHVYTTAGDYSVTLTVTSSGGTSATVVYTGQMVSRNGGASATTQRSVAVAPQPIVVVPLAPVATEPTCENPEALVLDDPEVVGVEFQEGGAPVVWPRTLTAADPTATLTSVAQAGYVLDPDATSSWTFTYVAPVCPPPTVTLTDPGAQTSERGEDVTLALQAVASNGEPVVFSAEGLPAGLAIDPDSGVITGAGASAGSYTVSVSACATSAPTSCDTASFRWTMLDPSGPGEGTSGSLPGTGADSTAQLAVAGAMLCAGALLFSIGRRLAGKKNRT